MGVTGIADATQIAAGEYNTCALLSGGSVDCWGWAGDGDLGDGTTTGQDTCGGGTCSAPVAVSGITNATEIAAGDTYYTCALLSGGGSRLSGGRSARTADRLARARPRTRAEHRRLPGAADRRSAATGRPPVGW